MPYRLVLALPATLVLAACTGADGSACLSPAGAPQLVPYSTATVFVGLNSAAEAEALSAAVAEPTYHLAPMLPPAPYPDDQDGSSASASLPPRMAVIPPELRGAPTRQLSVASLRPSSAAIIADPATAGGAVSVTYSPAQIRAAYALPPVPSSLAGITSLQAAQLGAGQTIYLIDAQDDPAAYGELLAFSQLFGLPACTQKTLAAGTSTLPAASMTGCEFYQVYASPAGAPTSTAPTYDPKWAVEIAMDVQWAHAIAPMARLVLIEASAPTMAAMTGAIQLANQLGPGIVSMSFGTPEASFAPSVESLFQVANMSYFAATGDNGAGVLWPSASPEVVAVGGTSLSYTAGGRRAETAWASTDGGLSAFFPSPAYQGASAQLPAPQRFRTVADVAMNADPNTGQYVAVVPNATTCSFCQISWLTAGGTSLSTPQWAGLAALSNALRAQANKPALGDPHAALYGPLASSASAYAANFGDVLLGSNGTCSLCLAKKGYDGPTGLGTPNGLSIVNALAGLSTTATPNPPTVPNATVTGAYGQRLAFTVSVSAQNAYTVTLSGAPAGMTSTADGVVTWPNPITGTYTVVVSAKDAKTGLTGKGTYTVSIAPPPPPIASSGSVSATVGLPLSFTVGAGDLYPCKISLSGAPAGMSITAGQFNSGTVSWPKPVAGTYSFSIVVRDSQTGLSATGLYALAVNPAGAPQVSSGNVGAVPGTALSFPVSVASINPYTLSLSGAPSGMAIATDGTVSWPSPTAGTFTVAVVARDTKTGLSGTGLINVRADANAGPQIMSTPMTGAAGKPFSASVSITDASSNIVGTGIGGGPLGMTIQGGFSGATLAWAKPVAGNYTIQISATDAKGRSAMGLIPLTISK